MMQAHLEEHVPAISCHIARAACLAPLLTACSLFDATDSDLQDTDDTPSVVGFRMQPSLASLHPGECSYHTIEWSGETLLSPSEVSFEFPVGIHGEYQAIAPMGVVHLCAGDVLGEGDILARLTGDDTAHVVGQAYNRLPNPRDADPREATWTRGTAREPSRVFWSDSGTEVYVASGDSYLLDVYDGFTGVRLDTHLTHSEIASLVDSERVIVSFPERAAIYNLADRSYETWFETVLFQPGHDFSAVPEDIYESTGLRTTVAAANGRILTLGYGFNACHNRLVDLEPYASTQVSLNSSDGFPSGLEAQAGLPDLRWNTTGLENSPVGRWAEVSQTGRFVHYGPKSCNVNGATLVDLETGSVHPECIPAAEALFGTGPSLSRDESVLVGWSYASGTVTLDAVSTPDCSPIAQVTLLGTTNTGFAVHPDGTHVALAYTEPDPPLGVSYAGIDIRVYDLTSATPSSQIAEWSIDAHFVAGDQHLRAHRLAYSPDGTRLAVVDAKGRFYLVDTATGAVTNHPPFDWGSAQLTPNPRRVLVKREDPFPRNWMLVDPLTQEVLHEHEEDTELFEAALAEGYVMRHPGFLTNELHSYDADTPPVPFEGDLDDAFDPDVHAADDGSTCSFESDGTVCMGETCRPSNPMRAAELTAPTDCVLIRPGWALFQHGQDLYSWNGVSDQYTHFSSLPGRRPTAMKNLMRTADGHVFYQNASHLLYWSL